MFYKWRKSRNLKRMISALPGEFATRYGVLDFYTPGQVNKTLEAKNYSLDFEQYAQIIFINPEVCVPDIMSKKLYETLRDEVAEQYFDGDRNFAAKLVKARVVGNTGFTTYSVGQQGSGSHDR